MQGNGCKLWSNSLTGRTTSSDFWTSSDFRILRIGRKNSTQEKKGDCFHWFLELGSCLLSVMTTYTASFIPLMNAAALRWEVEGEEKKKEGKKRASPVAVVTESTCNERQRRSNRIPPTTRRPGDRLPLKVQGG